MFAYNCIYVYQSEKDSTIEPKRKYNETKLTYAQYHGDIPKDDDPADYRTPIKAASIV